MPSRGSSASPGCSSTALWFPCRSESWAAIGAVRHRVRHGDESIVRLKPIFSGWPQFLGGSGITFQPALMDWGAVVAAAAGCSSVPGQAGASGMAERSLPFLLAPAGLQARLLATQSI